MEKQLLLETENSAKLSDEVRLLNETLDAKSFEIQERLKTISQMVNSTEGLQLDIKSKENKIQQLMKEKLQLKKQLDESIEFKSASKDFEQRFNSCNQTLEKLSLENSGMQQSILELQAENAIKEVELKNLLATPDHIQVETIRGKKDKLVVKASRVQRLMMIFDTGADVRDLEYKITSPSGVVLPASSGYPVSKIINPSVRVPGRDQIFQRVEMVYSSPKLTAGTYSIQVLSKGTYLTSVQLRLR
ncbi:MAG: hypothetical protein QM734_05210 [Cyclobacteriaceae bacterium]